MLRRRPDVTSLRRRSAKSINATLYSARGQAENLIKQHKRKRLRTITAAVHPSPISLILNITRVDQHLVPNPKGFFISHPYVSPFGTATPLTETSRRPFLKINPSA